MMDFIIILIIFVRNCKDSREGMCPDRESEGPESKPARTDLPCGPG